MVSSRVLAGLCRGCSRVQKVCGLFRRRLDCTHPRRKKRNDQKGFGGIPQPGNDPDRNGIRYAHVPYERTNERDEHNVLPKRDEPEKPPPPESEPNDDFPDTADFTARQLFDLWNQNCSPLPKVRKLTSGIREKIKTRLEEEPDLAYWETAIRNLSTSKFCQDSKWADFHWLIKNDTNHTKAFANKYGGDPPGPDPNAVPDKTKDPIGYAKHEIARINAEREKREKGDDDAS